VTKELLVAYLKDWVTFLGGMYIFREDNGEKCKIWC